MWKPFFFCTFYYQKFLFSPLWRFVFLCGWACCNATTSQHETWVWWIPGIMASYVLQVCNHDSPAAAYCSVKLSEIYSEAGMKQLDYIIIYREKKALRVFTVQYLYPTEFISSATSQHTLRSGIFSYQTSVDPFTWEFISCVFFHYRSSLTTDVMNTNIILVDSEVGKKSSLAMICNSF